MKKCINEYGLGKIMTLWICVLGVLVCASSCDSDRVDAGGVGKLRLSLAADIVPIRRNYTRFVEKSVKILTIYRHLLIWILSLFNVLVA